MSDACLAIDGVTDTSQLGNVSGYISASNNDTGEVLNNVKGRISIINGNAPF